MVLKWWPKLNEVKKRCPIVFQGHPSNLKVTQDKKITGFDPNWAFPVCNSSFNSPVALKWRTKLDVVENRCPNVFQGHRSNFTAGVYTNFSGRLSEEPFPWPIQRFPCILIFKTGQPGCQLNLSKGQIRVGFDERTTLSVKPCFKVTRDKKLPILTPVESFPDCNSSFS